VADLARGAQSRSADSLIARLTAAAAVMRNADPALEQLLDIVKHVIAVFDVPLHALAQPILIDAGQVGHGPRGCELVGNGGNKLGFRLGACKPVLVHPLKSIEQFLLGRKHRFSVFLRLVEWASEVDRKSVIGSWLLSRHDTLPKIFTRDFQPRESEPVLSFGTGIE
jgi:hypothetical protein